MTREEILAMPAGREMDKEINTSCFQRPLWYGDPTGFDIAENIDWWLADTIDENEASISYGEYRERLPFYSTDISAAWEVVEKLKLFELSKHDGYWTCQFSGGQYIESVDGDTAPLAICRAALLTVTA